MKDFTGNIREKTTRYKNLIQNFSYLSGLQAFNMLLPLITYPYLIRILGLDKYGLVIFAQSAVAYFTIFISFGFNITATKKISIERSDKNSLTNIVNCIFILKTAFLLLSLLILSALIFIIPAWRQEKFLYFLCTGALIYEVIFPIWYFQGIEQMKYITYINVTVKLIGAIFIFIIIKKPSHYLLLPAINSITSIIGGIYAIKIIYVDHKIKLLVPSSSSILQEFKEAIPIFISRIGGFVKEKSNIIVIGILLGNKAVAFYDLANKLINVITNVGYNVSQVIFPALSKTKDKGLSRKTIKLSFIVNLAITIFMLLFNQKIITIIGGIDMLGTKPVLNILSGLIILLPVSSLFGIVLLTNDHFKFYSFNMILSTGFYLIAIIMLYITKNINLNTVSFALLASVVFELLHKYYGLYRKGLKQWIY